MPPLLLSLLLLWTVEPGANEASWAPLPLSLDCQSDARVDACTYAEGILRELPLVVLVPRGRGKATLYLNAVQVAAEDHVHLRIVTEIPGAPPAFEQVGVIDSRAGIDEQRAALQPALYRALAPVIAIEIPGTVAVTYTAPSAPSVAPPTTPWGFYSWLGGSGSWTESYQYLSAWTGLAVTRTTNQEREYLNLGYSRSISQQPPIQVGNRQVPLTTDASTVSAAMLHARNLDTRWTLGALLRAGANDPEGHYLATSRAHAGVERNWFPSDDPRGNRLALAYLLGAQSDWYHVVNTLGETEALFPTHMLLAMGSVKLDRITLDLDLSTQAELVDPMRRYVLAGESDTSVMVGKHLDITVKFGVSRQKIPGPGEIDTSNYEEVIRASYAEPLKVWGNLGLNLHWDNNNGARNNRFEAAENLGSTTNL